MFFYFFNDYKKTSDPKNIFLVNIFSQNISRPTFYFPDRFGNRFKKNL